MFNNPMKIYYIKMMLSSNVTSPICISEEDLIVRSKHVIFLINYRILYYTYFLLIFHILKYFFIFDSYVLFIVF